MNRVTTTPERRPENPRCVDDKYATRDRRRAVIVHVFMVSLQVTFPVLDRLTVFGHHSLELDGDFDGRWRLSRDRSTGRRVGFGGATKNQIYVPGGRAHPEIKVQVIDDFACTRFCRECRASVQKVINDG
jgi:hypothetical protein